MGLEGMGLRRRPRAAAGLAALACTAAFACTPKPLAPAPLPAPAPGYPDAAYRLAPGDLLDVRFHYNADLDDTLRIRPDGAITIERIGDVAAAGQTPSELAEAIRERFSGVIRHPEVSVIVRESGAQQVYVGGEVSTPGAVALHGSITSLQAILERGGAKNTGNLYQVVLLRYVSPEEATVQQIDLHGVLAGKRPDVLLRPYDVVYVPMTPIAVLGDFVEQYINKIVPRNLSFPFPYNLNPDIVTE